MISLIIKFLTFFPSLVKIIEKVEEWVRTAEANSRRAEKDQKVKDAINKYRKKK